MRLRASLAMAGVIVLFLLSVSFFVAKSVSQFFFSQEKSKLTGIATFILPIVSGQGLFDLQDLHTRLNVDISILGSNGAIQQTSLPIPPGASLNVPDNVFQISDLVGVRSFFLSSPFTVNGETRHLVISEPDVIVGSLLDTLLTWAVVFLLVGVGVAVLISFWLLHSEQKTLLRVGEAFNALSLKNFSFRLPENVGGASFKLSRDAFNRSMEEMRKLHDTTDDFIRSRMSAKEGEERALLAAVGSVDEGVIIIDATGSIAAFNSAMEKLSGFLFDNVRGKKFRDVVFLSREGASELSHLIPRIISTGFAEVFPPGTRIKRSDGVFVPVSIKTIPVKNDIRSKVTHVAIVVQKLPQESKLKEERQEVRSAPPAPRAAPPPAPPAAVRVNPAPPSPALPRLSSEWPRTPIPISTTIPPKPSSHGASEQLPQRRPEELQSGRPGELNRKPEVLRPNLAPPRVFQEKEPISVEKVLKENEQGLLERIKLESEGKSVEAPHNLPL